MPAATDPLKVQLEVFQGPLDLLLFLVRRFEVDVFDVTLADITHAFADHMEEVEKARAEAEKTAESEEGNSKETLEARRDKLRENRLDLDNASDFIALAANLIYWKSRCLLPKRDQDESMDDFDESDPQWELVRQLIEYKKFKDSAALLAERQLEQSGSFRRNPGENLRDELAEQQDESLLIGEVSLLDLLEALRRVIKRVEERVETRNIRRESFTVGDKIRHLLDLAQIGQRLRFTELFDDATSKQEVVVTFLALLELIRLGHFGLSQDTAFNDITVERLNVTADAVELPPNTDYA